MKITIATALAVASLALSACNGQPTKLSQDQETTILRAMKQVASDFSDATRSLYINHHKVECEGFQVTLCYLVRESEDEP